MAKACGILFCYNESHIIAHTVRHYLSAGIDLVLFDNESTDDSVEVARAAARELAPTRRFEVVTVRTQGYEWIKILKTACDYMHARLSAYDWILLVDADAFYDSPVRSGTLSEFLDENRRAGFNVIDGRLYNFYPTEADDPAIPRFWERLRYARIEDPSPQHKIFRYHPSIDFYSRAGHECRRKGARLSPLRFRYRHYPWLELAQGQRKVFHDRNPRYTEQRDSAEGLFEHPQYRGLLPIEEDFVKPSLGLRRVSYETEGMSFGMARAILATGRVGSLIARGLHSYRYGKVANLRRRWRSGQVLLREPKLIAAHLSFRGRRWAWSVRRALSRRPPSRLWNASPIEIAEQSPRPMGLPSNIHFLVTDFCNAACRFCNQDFRASARAQLSFTDFKTMLAHLPLDAKTAGWNFTFSGGGEPLLAKELFAMIDFTGRHYPWVRTQIRTNGTRIGKLADEIAASSLSRLEISIQSADPGRNRAEMGSVGDTLGHLETLNDRLLKYGNGHLETILSVAVSQRNIDDLEGLVRAAGVRGVDEVQVSFVRYYAWSDAGKASPQESLFYAQDRYDAAVRRAKRVARRYGVRLSHEPLFSTPVTSSACRQPWCTLVVDVKGRVFPCTGGEVWFKHGVADGRYDFGNLLASPLTHFWLNESFTRVRRTCRGESLVAECASCHNNVALKGPSVEASHRLPGPPS
jgi:MoaA/NifB/PqqE/SkfB family radical SAM enzyme/glycosyltransferase involved in cell wall biosynthesis